MKQTIQQTEKLYSRSNKDNFESDDEDYVEAKKAPMSLLLPSFNKPYDNETNNKKISDASQSSIKTEDEDESEYTYETGKIIWGISLKCKIVSTALNKYLDVAKVKSSQGQLP